MQVIINNQGWTLVGSGSFILNNAGGRRAYLVQAAAPPPASFSVNEANFMDPSEELTDFATGGDWYGRCDNENSATLRTCDMRVQPY